MKRGPDLKKDRLVPKNSFPGWFFVCQEPDYGLRESSVVGRHNKICSVREETRSQRGRHITFRTWFTRSPEEGRACRIFRHFSEGRVTVEGPLSLGMASPIRLPQSERGGWTERGRDRLFWWTRDGGSARDTLSRPNVHPSSPNRHELSILWF